MSDSDKQALLDGTAAIQTEIVVHNNNLFKIDSFIQIPDGIIVSNNTIIMGNTTYQPIVYLIKVENNQSYTISFNSSTTKIYRMQVKASDSSGTAGTVLLNGSITSLAYSDSFTATSEYIRIEFFQSTSTDEQIISNIRLEEGTPFSLTETNSVIDWNHEDFRQVKNEGFIGQFVARQLTGNLKNLGDDFCITDKELELKMGVKVNNDTNWYSLGNFLVTKVTDNEVHDKTSFEALDYTKKFNKEYENTIEYPCTALQLAQNVCAQCGVELGNNDFKNNDYVITGNVFTNNESCRDVMKAIGKLAFSWVRVDWDNKVYIDFDSSSFRNLFDGELESGDLNSSNGNNETNNNRVRTTNFIEVKSATKYLISTNVSIGRIIQYDANKNFIRYNAGSDNPLTTTSTTKYVRFSLLTTDTTTNVLYNQQPSEYDTIANNKYYNLKTQKEIYGPVDKVVIGYSAIEGERTYIGNVDGECVINIFDNPLVFSQEQRASIINSAKDLLGMTYMPLNTQTVGHPWLKGNELVRVSDMEGVSHDTIPLDRTIQYFGHIKTVIDSSTPTKTNDSLSYKPEMVKNYERSEIYNDQVNKEIGIIVEQQTDTTNRLNQTVSTLDGTVQRVSRTETTVNDITTTTQVSIGKNHLYLEDAMQSNALNYQVDGATEQDSYSGKNLLQTKFPFNTTYNGVTCTTDADGTITLNGTPTTRTDFTVISALMTLQANTKYSLNYIYVSGSMNGYLGIYNEDGNHSWQGWDLEIPRAESTNNKSISHTYTYDWNSSLSIVRTFQDTTYNNLKFKIQLVSNSDSDYEYEPYVGGTVSPNPDYPQRVKNIPTIINSFNINDFLNLPNNSTYYELYDNDKIKIKASDTRPWANMLFGIPVEPNTTYYFSAKNFSGTNNRIQLCLKDSSYANVGNPFVIGLGNSFTTTSNTAYLGVKFIENNNSGIFSNIQLEEGTVAHEYVPYGAYARVKITGKNMYDYNFRNSTNNIRQSNCTVTINNDTFTLISSGSGDSYIWEIIPQGRDYDSDRAGKLYTFEENEYILSISDATIDDNYITYYDLNKKSLGYIRSRNSSTSIKKTDMVNAKYFSIRMGQHSSQGAGVTHTFTVQLEQGETSTSYEPYKEQEVLIDLAKENLFTNDEERYWNKSANIYKTDNGVRIIQPDSGQYRFAGYILDANPMLGKTFTISCDYKSSNTNNVPLVNIFWFNKSTNNITTQIKALSANGGTFSVPSTANNDNIAILFYSNLNGSSSAANDYTDYINIKLFEGASSTPYYELCKIGDYKDTLSIDSNGNCIINKNIYKIDMNSGTLSNYGYVSRNSNANYSQFNIVLNTSIKPNPVSNDSSQWGSTFKSKYFSYYNGADIPNKTQPGMKIYNNYPDIVLSFPTPLLTTGQESASFINWANSNNLSIYGVLRTPETITLPNTKIPLFDGINLVTFVDDLETSTSISYYRKTPLSGTYATVTQLNDVSTEKTTEIQTVRQEMLLNISNEAVRINAINQTIDETGVPIVTTTTGYTFDSEGLKLEKSDNDVKTLVDNDGLSVSYKNEEKLTVCSNGVNAENMTVRKFYVQKPIRMEKTKAASDGTSVGLGFFYIGE